jgi:hypothetical protein
MLFFKNLLIVYIKLIIKRRIFSIKLSKKLKAKFILKTQNSLLIELILDLFKNSDKNKIFFHFS